MFIRLFPIITGLLLHAFPLSAQLTDNFSDGNFTSDPVWTGDTTRYLINTSGQLQLKGIAASDTAYLSTPFNLSGNTEWNIWVKLSFSPSGSNYMKIYLMADTLGLKDPLNGYYIRIGESGSLDGIDLFRQNGLTSAKIIDGISGRAAKTTNTFRIKVKRDTFGTWTLYSDTLGGNNFSKEGTATDSTFSSASFFGVSCRYSSSNASKFYFDDIYAGPLRVDSTAPKIVSVNVISQNTIDIRFSEPPEKLSAENTGSYLVDYGIGFPVLAVQEKTDPAVFRLSFPGSFQNGWLHSVEVSGIADVEGNTLNNGKIKFAWYSPAPGDVVINEVLFNPYEGGEDFIEIYNRSDKTADIKKIRVAGADYVTGNVLSQNNLSDSSQFLLPGSYTVLSENPGAVKFFYRTKNPDAFVAVPTMPSYNNDRGVVLLTDSSETILDQFCYSEKMHHPLLHDLEGVSLERIHYNRPASDSTNWHSAAEDAGFATPGYRNSQYSEKPASRGTITVEPELFSPDNDGHHDVVNIQYKFDAPGFMANAAVYDASGRLTRYLLQNELLGSEGTFSWNGITEKYEKAAIGIYVIFLEVFDLNGNIEQFKKTCVLSGK